MTYDIKIIQALQDSSYWGVFDDAFKKKIYSLSQNLDPELYKVLLKILNSKWSGDLNEQKLVLSKYLEKLKKKTEIIKKEGMKKIHEAWEKVQEEIDEWKNDDLLSRL